MLPSHRLRTPGSWPTFHLYLLPLALLLLSSCQQQPPPPAYRFGVVESYEAPAAASALGASWTRVRFHWGDIQPEHAGQWRPSISRDVLQSERDAGRQLVGLIIGIPDWARDDRLLPQGLHLAPEDPDNTIAVFISKLVQEHHDLIHHWIVWNEPDIWDKQTPGHTWDGDERDFAQLQRTAYHVIKSVDPDAIIHLAAMTYYWDANFGRPQYLGRLLDALQEDPSAPSHNYYFDIATAHLYFQPDAIYNILIEFQNIMQDRGINHPIWLIETNAPPTNDPSWPVESITLHVSLEDQAIFQTQALAAALAAGAQRIAIYKLVDLASDRAANPEPFGLIRQDGTHRPAFAAAQVAFRLMAGTLHAKREAWSGHAQIRLEQKDRITHVLFSRLGFPQTATIPAISNEAQLIDMWGNTQRVKPQGGNYLIALPKSTCNQPIADYCMIGGRTYYLVQSITGKRLFSAFPDPLPTTTTPP